jgi:hypothetical protein
LAYIKAITLLITIFSSFIFPVQGFTDARFGVESSEDSEWIISNPEITNRVDDLVKSPSNQIMAVDNSNHSAATINEIPHVLIRRNSNIDVLSSAEQLIPKSREEDSPITGNESPLEVPTIHDESEHKGVVDQLPANSINATDNSSQHLTGLDQTQDQSSPKTDTTISLPPVPVIAIQYDANNNYNARQTWQGVEDVDLLARSMLAEENEKLFDIDRLSDLIGAGWVMVNRTRVDNGHFHYAIGDLYRAVTPFQQFALGGYIEDGSRVYPGNVAYVANPEAYPRWFGDKPREAYWKAYEIAQGILDGSIPDPTYGALFFADAFLDENNHLIYYPDGRTRFWYRYAPSYTIPQLHNLENPPWPKPSHYSGSFYPWPGMQHESQNASYLKSSPQNN